MPRALTYWPPGEVRLILADARDEGLPFDAAWKRALARTRFPRGGGSSLSDPSGRDAWKLALAATREEWRRAYEGEPSPGAEALAALIGAVEGQSELPPIAA